MEVERRKMIWESKAELNSTKAQVSTLAALLESTRDLFESTGSVSKEELVIQELEYAVAVVDKQRLENAEERERIEYEMALDQHHKRSLMAPFQGIITELYLDEGETLEADEPLEHMVDISRCVFICDVEERVGRNLKIGQSVELEIRAGAESLLKKGRIVFVCPVVDPASGLLKVKAVFDNQDEEIHPGVAGVMYLENAGVAVAD